MSNKNKLVHERIMYVYTKSITNILFYSMIVGILLICIYSFFQIHHHGLFSNYSIQSYSFFIITLFVGILSLFSLISMKYKRYFIVFISFLGWIGALISYGYMSSASLYILPFIIYISLLGHRSLLIKYLALAMSMVILFYLLQAFGYTGNVYIAEDSLIGFHIIIGEAIITCAIIYATVILSLGYMKLMVQLVDRLIRKNTSLKERNEHQKFLLGHDALTGARSRSYLMNYIEETVEQKKESFILVMANICNFKQINDKYGHAKGDAILALISKKYQEFLNETHSNGFVSRLSGDEFCLYIPKMRIGPCIKRLNDLTDEITRIIKRTMSIIFYSIRYGIVEYPSDSDKFDKLLHNINLAMLYSKENNLPSVLFSKDIQNYYASQAILKEQCIEIVNENLFEVFFQKQIDIKTNQCVGGEVLIRPDKRFNKLSPWLVSMLCDKYALAEELNRRVIQKSLMYLKYQTPNTNCKISFNLLLPKVLLIDHIHSLMNMIVDSHVSEKFIFCFEIVESNDINQKELDQALEVIRKKGFEVSIDDFGVQYSNYKRIQSKYISALKIDQSFIRDLDNPRKISVVQSIIAMAKANKISIVAEGVETEKELTILKKLNCDYVQGFYFHRPEIITAINFENLSSI